MLCMYMCETQKRKASTDSDEVPFLHSIHPDSQAVAQEVSALGKPRGHTEDDYDPNSDPHPNPIILNTST